MRQFPAIAIAGAARPPLNDQRLIRHPDSPIEGQTVPRFATRQWAALAKVRNSQFPIHRTGNWQFRNNLVKKGDALYSAQQNAARATPYSRTRCDVDRKMIVIWLI